MCATAALSTYASNRGGWGGCLGFFCTFMFSGLTTRENISASLTSLARRENAIDCDACESRNLQLTNKQNLIQSEKLVLDPKFSQDSRIKISNDSRESRHEISVCETRESCYEICLRDSREASLATKFFSARLVRSDSCYEIS
jgi:hypothetical protein